MTNFLYDSRKSIEHCSPDSPYSSTKQRVYHKSTMHENIPDPLRRSSLRSIAVANKASGRIDKGKEGNICIWYFRARLSRLTIRKASKYRVSDIIAGLARKGHRTNTKWSNKTHIKSTRQFRQHEQTHTHNARR